MATATTHRELGKSGLKVSPIGLGCMGMSEFYDPKAQDDAESIRVIHRYLDGGGNFLDTADVYGVGRNEALVGKAIAGRRDEVVLATKFANVRGPKGEFLGVRGDAGYVRECCDASLQRLERRRDRPVLPAPGRPQDADRGDRRRDGRTGAGRARSATSGCPRRPPATIRRAATVHPIAALQTEYSLWSRDPEDEILADRPRAGDRLRRLQPARPRVPHRPVQVGRGLRRGRLPPELAAVPGGELREEPRPGRQGRGDRPRPRAAPPASSPSPGSSRRATTSSRSPGPSARSISTRTWAPCRSS